MKKIFATAAFVAMALSASAQTNPNRVLVRDIAGGVKGFLAERIDSIYFAKVEGRVAADLTFKSFEKTDEGATINLAVKKTDGCTSFRICCLASNLAGRMNETEKASYVESYGTEKLYDDFSQGAQLTIGAEDMTFAEGTKYTLMTVGYDGYDIPCSVSEAEFTTPKADVKGSPAVSCTLHETTTTTFTITFTPNEDCAGYAFCAFDEGTVESTFASMGAMFGYANIGDMIKGWCQNGGYSGRWTQRFTDMTPGKTYDVAIQPWDKNGTYADYTIYKVTTKANGGSGAALVSFDIPSDGFYKYDNNGTTEYYQRVVFTPNDQTNIYHNMLVEKSYYDKDPDSYWDYLKQDMNMVGWDRTATDDDTWNVNPETEYYALAWAKNASGEYGEKCSQLFKTPSADKAVDMPTSAPKAGKAKGNGIASRFGLNAKTYTINGTSAHKFAPKKGITLVAK